MRSSVDQHSSSYISSSPPPPALLRTEIKQLINESLKNSYPKLVDLTGAFVTVKGDALVMYGDDYQWYVALYFLSFVCMHDAVKVDFFNTCG